MGYGDAYIRVVVIADYNIKLARQLCGEYEKLLNFLGQDLTDYEKNPNMLEKEEFRNKWFEREKQYFAVMNRIIGEACKGNRAVFLVATDFNSGGEPWRTLSERGYSLMAVKDFQKEFGEITGCTKDLDEFKNRYLIIIHSHYDTDDDLMDQLGRTKTSRWYEHV